jgi:subfamily B ATP-binding cassette protein MsbA
MSVSARLLAYLRPHRGTLAAALLCMTVLALTTGAYAFLMGPMLRFLVTGGAAGLRGLEGAARVFPSLRGLDRERAFSVLPALLFAVAFLKSGAYLGQFYLMGMLGQRVVATLRRELYASLLRKDPSFFVRAQVGDLLSRFTSDVAHVERAATYAVASCLKDGLSLLVLLALAFALDWRLSLLAFVAVPLAAVPVSRLSRRLRRRAAQGQESLGRLTALVQEGLWGLKVVQAYGMERRELARFDRELLRLLTAERRSALSRSAGPLLLELGAVTGIAIALFVSAGAVLDGSVAPDRLVSFLATLALLYQPAKDLGRVGPLVIAAQVSAARLFEAMDSESALQDGPRALDRVREGISLEGVSYSYGERPVLSGFDLRLSRGEIVALVGESGAGKSTVALLAQRFADPSSGTVRVDGSDAREATLASVRAQFGLVTQDALLFSGSAAENIGFGRKGATREDVERAARLAQADGFIRALPLGYDTPLGERGSRLSGGQRQCIALARALISDAPVLLLDEATSSLDAISEREVNAALESALVNRTALVIAHRLSTVKSAHRIAVLKGGRVVEGGTHEALIAAGGEYARLQLQQGSG